MDARINSLLNLSIFVTNSYLNSYDFSEWTSITDSQISSLFTSYNNKTNLKDSIVKLALELIEAVPAKASVISNALYTTLGTSSATNITNAKLVDLAKTHIFDTTKLGTIRDRTSTKTSNDIEIYKGLRTVSLRKNRQEFTNNAFIQTVKDISNNDDDNLLDDYILDLNADLSLNLQGFDLCGVDLTGIDLQNANLKDTDLSGANLTNGILNNSDLSGANLTNTNLNNSKAQNISNTTTTTGTATNLPYSLKYYKNNLRLITEDLTTGSISTSDTSIGPFTEGQTIIVNGVQVIIGKGVTDAGLVNADQDRNGDSFTFLKKDNKVATWGNKVRGGNITLDISNVKQVYANNYSKVVLSKRGTLYAWGDSRYGATLPTDISGVIDVFPNEKAYTALHVDGTVSCWGDSTTGGTAPTDLSGVVNVFNNQQAFTALLSDGGVVSWGKTTGSYPTSKNFIKVYSTLDGFAGLKSDGTVESWGSKYPSLNTPPTDLSNVAIVYQNDRAYAALLANGTVQGWGHVDYGGKSNVSSLTNIKKIYNNDHAFCALSYSGALSCWGNTSYGGTLPSTISDAVEVFATSTAFTAKRTNNEIYSWGEASNGGTTPIEETKVEKRKTIILNDRGGVVIKDNDDIVQFGIDTEGNETYNLGFRFNRLISNVKKVVYNENAFAVLKKDGTVVVWGRETAGGDASAVQSNLTDIVDIYPNRYSFVAINSSYNLYGWGGTGGAFQIANLDATITDVSSVVVNHTGYAFLQKNGDVSIAGSATTSADLTSVTKIYANYNAYAAIKSDGSVVTWGTGTSGGDSSSVSSNLTNVVEIYPSYGAFAAVKSNGSVVTWGHASYGSNSSSVSSSLTSGVEKIFSTERAFAALKSNGSIVAWGDSNYGGSSSSVSSNLTSGVEKIFKTERAFAALKSDGSVYSWGNSSYGGTTPGITSVSTIIPNKQTFVALKTDNTVSAWGNSSYGSNLAHSSLGIRDHQTDAVNTSLNQNITKVVASERAFAAIRSDGSIVTWGTHQYGGSLHSSTYGVVANGGTLSSFSKKAIDIVSSANNFVVLFEDFTISGWGSKLDFGNASKYLINIEKPTLEKDHEETVSAFNNKNINFGRTYFASTRVNNFETTTTAAKYIDKIYSTDSAFAGHKQDGSVVVWGNSNFGGDSSSVSSLSTVSQIISTRGAFMAKKQDGTHFFWGNSNFGGFSSPANSLAISNKLQDINFYCSSYRKNNLRALYDINRDTRSLEKFAVTVNNSANAQINVDGTITAWGNSSHGGSTTSINDVLINTKNIVAGENTFVSLRSDGQLKAWKTNGITMGGSDYKKVVSGLGGDTLALKKDGTMKEFKQNSWSTSYSFDAATDTANSSWATNNDLNVVVDNITYSSNGKYIAYSDTNSYLKIFNTQTKITYTGSSYTNITGLHIDNDANMFFIYSSNRYSGLFDITFNSNNTFTVGRNINSTTSMNNQLSISDNLQYLFAYDKFFLITKTHPASISSGNTFYLTTSNHQINGYGKISRDGLFVAIGGSATSSNPIVYNSVTKTSNFKPIFIFKRDTSETTNTNSMFNYSTPQAMLAVGNSNIDRTLSDNFVFNGNSDKICAAPNFAQYSLYYIVVFSYNSGTDSWSLTHNVSQTSGNFLNPSRIRSNLNGNQIIGVTYNSPKTIVSYDLNSNTNTWSPTTLFSSNVNSLEVNKNASDLVIISSSNNAVRATFTEVKILPTNIINIYAFNKTFAAIDKNNALYIWGDNSNLLTNISNKSSDLSSNICEVYANDHVLVAKTFDNTLITIGKAENGGNIDATDNQYKLYGGTATDIDEVYLNDMFAVALKTDDTCIYWGDISRNTTLFESDITKFTDIRQIISSKDVTIAINTNGKVFGLGEKSKGASIPSTLTSGVSKIYSATLNGFAALKYDNSIIGWGEDASFNYTLASTNENGFRDISGEIVNIYSNDGAFTALKRNGTVLSWGKANYGSTAPTDISNVTDIIPGPDTFTAVVNNHTTITWGNTSTGSTIYNYNNNLRYSQVLDRTFSNSNKLNTVLNNNYKVTTAYIHNNNDININKIQIRSAEETRILDNFNLRSYNSMRSIVIPTNLQVNSNTMVNLGINNDAKRHMVLDNIFSNSTETSLITSSYGLNLNKRLNKTNVNVLAANTSTEMDLTSSSTQITKTQGAYANLSDLNDNVTVNLDDSNKFKVTRTTAKTATGKYIITCVLGTITMVKGIYTNIYTQNQSSYECSDGEEVYINKVKFTFGGFGTDGINHSQKDAYLPIVYNDRVICYLNSNGKVITIGTTSDHGAYPNKGDHSIMKNSFYTDVSGGVIQVVSNKKGFAALKSDGTVRSWGHTMYNSMNGINTFADSILHLNYDIIKLFSNENYYVALKKNRDVITWGYVAAKNGQGRIFSYLNNSIYNSFSDPIKPFKNVFKVIMNNYATALLTYDNEVITFGDHRHGGDYNDFLYGINGRQNTFITNDVHTGVLTNVKKVIGLSRNSANDNSGFAALKKDGSVVFWGSIKYSTVSNQTNIDDLSNNIIDIEPLMNGFYIKYSNESIKVITSQNITSSSTNFSNISNDISKNIIQMVSNSQAAAFLRSDNTLFLLGSNSYGAVLSTTYYLDTDRTDIVNDYTLNNVQKVFASQRGFTALKTNGSVVCWGYNSTSSTEDNNNAIVNLYGGSLVNIKHIHSNMFAWCAVKHDGTIVTWTNSNDVAKFGGNFIDSEYGINSTSFGGDGLATTFINGKIERNGVISVKEVVPIRKQGFVAIVNDNDEEEKLLLWGLPNYPLTKAQIDACNSHTETVHGLSNTYPVNYYDFKHVINNDANYGNERFANYEKFIDVSLNSNSKFVFNNDPSTNPILDKTLNYTFTVPSSLVSGTGFKIINTPYSTNTTLLPTQYDSSNHKLETTLNNKYYLFSSNSGISTGSLYNDSTITTDISEGQIVETIYNSSTKTSFSNYNTLGNNNLIPDASLNIIAYTNYKDRGAILDLIHKSLNIKHSFITTNLTSLDITKSSINFHKMLYYSETLQVYDTDTFIDLSSNSSVSNCFIGNLAKTQNKITLKTQHATFEIEKTNNVSGSERFIVRCLKGQIEINTSATNYTLTNKSKILTNSNFNDISLNYFIKDDYVLINDIEFLITSYGFITNGNKIKYKEIIITQNSEGTYLFNNLTTPPSIEYGENYKFITNNVLFKNKPFYLTKSTF